MIVTYKFPIVQLKASFAAYAAWCSHAGCFGAFLLADHERSGATVVSLVTCDRYPRTATSLGSFRPHRPQREACCCCFHKLPSLLLLLLLLLLAAATIVAAASANVVVAVATGAVAVAAITGGHS